MNKKIITFNPDKEHLLKAAYKIRMLVFVDEQNVDYEEEFDGLDSDSIHYLIFVDDIPAACARRRQTKEGHKLERFAVLKEYRGKALGAMLLNEMLTQILPTEEKIYLYAQAVAEMFYEKYGFKRVGNMFMEANIEHYKMVYEAEQEE